MNYKIYLYIFFTALSIFALSGININQYMKKNKAIEARIIVMILAFSFGYIMTNFVYDFINSIG